jgi:hypothetical protein
MKNGDKDNRTQEERDSTSQGSWMGMLFVSSAAWYINQLCPTGNFDGQKAEKNRNNQPNGDGFKNGHQFEK